MSIDAQQLRKYIIRPTLELIGYHSEASEELLMLTAAAESELGHYIHQVNGPALGIYQMESQTHDDIWGNWLKYKSLAGIVSSLGTESKDLIGNLYYATAMTRCHYLRVPEALPKANDIEALAQYHKKYYNTLLGSAEVTSTIKKYERLVVFNG